jgi:putative phage-type endonuclease
MDGASLSTLDRKSYLGGSEIAAVVGLSPYKTALDVWARKVLGIESPTSPAAEAGLVMEPGILELYRIRHGADDMRILGTCIDPDEPWIGATPDRVRDCGINVQAKLVGQWQASRWGVPDDGPEGVPPEVLCQIAWEANAIEKATGRTIHASHVPALLGTDLRVFVVPTDRAMIAMLIDAARTFWMDHVVTGRPPEITAEMGESARELVSVLYPKETRNVVDASDEIVRLALAYDAARAACDVADKHKSAVAAMLCNALGEHEGAQTEDGSVRVSWKTKTSSGTDWKGVAMSLSPSEETIARFARAGSRTLTVKVKR